MKPHHHLNRSILKVCENCTKLIFPITSLCYFCGFSSSLLHFPGVGEQVYMETWGTLIWFGNQKKYNFWEGTKLFFFLLLTQVLIYLLVPWVCLKRIWLTDSKLNLASGLNCSWAETLWPQGWKELEKSPDFYMLSIVKTLKNEEGTPRYGCQLLVWPIKNTKGTLKYHVLPPLLHKRKDILISKKKKVGRLYAQNDCPLNWIYLAYENWLLYPYFSPFSMPSYQSQGEHLRTTG